jgi:hypothetical protein
MLFTKARLRRLSRVISGALTLLCLGAGLANATSAIGQLNASITIVSRCTVVLHDAPELRGGGVTDAERALAIHCSDGTPTRFVAAQGDQIGLCDIEPACLETSVVEIEF